MHLNVLTVANFNKRSKNGCFAVLMHNPLSVKMLKGVEQALLICWDILLD